jgi:hypothetical protein
MSLLDHWRAISTGDAPTTRQASNAISRHIRTRKNGNDSGNCFGLVCTYLIDFPVRDRGSDYVCVKLVRTIHVIDVLPAPGDKTMVFFASNCGANTILNHASPRFR